LIRARCSWDRIAEKRAILNGVVVGTVCLLIRNPTAPQTMDAELLSRLFVLGG
jgi:hypothetical protein